MLEEFYRNTFVEKNCPAINFANFIFVSVLINDNYVDYQELIIYSFR